VDLGPGHIEKIRPKLWTENEKSMFNSQFYFKGHFKKNLIKIWQKALLLEEFLKQK
jgi:hypothetical protein